MFDDAALAAALDQLEATLNSPLGNMKGDYVVGQYTLADCAWAGVCQVATNMGKGSAVSSRAKVTHGLLLCNHIHLQRSYQPI